jgi:hypothetical protein
VTTTGEHSGVERLNERLRQALRERPAERARSTFSPYRPDNDDLSYRLAEAAEGGGEEGLERMLDTYDQLAAQEDPVALRHALMVALTHFPGLSGIGVSTPSLEERAPWKIAPK